MPLCYFDSGIREIDASAHHEMGHALLCVLCDVAVSKITVEPHGAGVVHHGPTTQWQKACICIGGPIAEMKYTFMPWSHLAKLGYFANDITSFNAATEAMAAADRGHHRRLASQFGDEAYAWAAQCVQHNWKFIQRGASELVRLGCLEGDRLDRLMGVKS